MDDPPAAPRQDLTYTIIPVLFLLLWSSGFIAAKAGLAHAETLTFLGLRYALVTLLMVAVCIVMRAPWPKSWREAGHIAIAGVMLQALYFGGVWLAMGKGVGAGVAALIVCMQPANMKPGGHFLSNISMSCSGSKTRRAVRVSERFRTNSHGQGR